MMIRCEAAPEKAAYFDTKNSDGVRTRILQTSDVWSLGCVLSVAATYVTHGVQGVRAYRKLRARQIKELTDCTLTAGDAFHDGTRVLPVVTEWHAFLRSIRGHSDVLTEKVLDMVDEEMLLPEDKRSDAIRVRDRFKRILSEAVLPPADFCLVRRFLQDIDVEAEVLPRRGSLLPDRANGAVEDQPSGLDLNATKDPRVGTSEEKLHSIPVKPTAQRLHTRPMSARQVAGEIQPLRRVYTDPPDARITGAGSRDEMSRMTAEVTKPTLAIVTNGQESFSPGGHVLSPNIPVQNVHQAQAELEKFGMGRDLGRTKSLRNLGKNLRKKEVSVRGKMPLDHIEDWLKDRDVVSFSSNDHYPGARDRYFH